MTRPPPREHLDPRARTLWRLTGLLQAVLVAIPTVVIAAGFLWFEWLPRPLVVLGVVVMLVALLFGVWPYPDLAWRHWRYEIGESEVDVQRGWWTVTRTLIPMARIQHVDTRRDPLQRHFGLATVVLYTAAGANEIPALAEEVAARARDQIATLANYADAL